MKIPIKINGVARELNIDPNKINNNSGIIGKTNEGEEIISYTYTSWSKIIYFSFKDQDLYFLVVIKNDHTNIQKFTKAILEQTQIREKAFVNNKLL